MSLYAGLLHSAGSVPPYFVWLDKISMIKYAFQAIVINEYGSDRYLDVIPGHDYGQVGGRDYICIVLA